MTKCVMSQNQLDVVAQGALVAGRKAHKHDFQRLGHANWRELPGAFFVCHGLRGLGCVVCWSNHSSRRHSVLRSQLDKRKSQRTTRLLGFSCGEVGDSCLPTPHLCCYLRLRKPLAQQRINVVFPLHIRYRIGFPVSLQAVSRYRVSVP